MSGGDLYPPANCCCRNCSLRNSSSYPGFYGGGGPQEFRLTREMGTDIHNLVRSMSAFLEDVRVAFGIEVKAGEKVDVPARKRVIFDVNDELKSAINDRNK